MRLWIGGESEVSIWDLFYGLIPGITEKKVPPRHQSRYIGFTLNAVYRKSRAVGVSIFFCIRKLKRYFFASEIFNSRMFYFLF
jgi:hypothetical protein